MFVSSRASTCCYRVSHCTYTPCVNVCHISSRHSHSPPRLYHTHHPIIVVTAANSASTTAGSICKLSPCRLHRIVYLFLWTQKVICNLSKRIGCLVLEISNRLRVSGGLPPYFLYCPANVVFCLINWSIVAFCCCLQEFCPFTFLSSRHVNWMTIKPYKQRWL